MRDLLAQAAQRIEQLMGIVKLQQEQLYEAHQVACELTVERDTLGQMLAERDHALVRIRARTEHSSRHHSRKRRHRRLKPEATDIDSEKSRRTAQWVRTRSLEHEIKDKPLLKVEDELPKQEPNSWWTYILNIIAAPFRWLWSLVKHIYNYFMGHDTPEPKSAAAKANYHQREKTESELAEMGSGSNYRPSKGRASGPEIVRLFPMTKSLQPGHPGKIPAIHRHRPRNL